MNIRTACLAIAFTIVWLPAYAQGGRPSGAGQTIQSLANQLAVLTERVAKLESGQVEPADLVGTYALFSLGIEMHGGAPASIGTETAAATLTFRADGTGSVDWTDKRFDLVEGMPWSVMRSEETTSGDFAWTLENGVLSLFGGEAQAAIGAGARMFVLGGSAASGAGSWSQLLIAIRLP